MKRRSLSLLSIGHLAVDVTGGALPAALPFLQREFGLSYLMLAAIATTYQLTSSISQPIFGALSDRRAYRFLMPLGVLLAAGGFSMLGIARTYPLLLGTIVLAGVGSAIFHPEATKSARYVAGPNRATGLSFFTVGGNIGVALGPLIFTALVAWRGLGGTVAYLAFGVLAALPILVIGPTIARAESAHLARRAAAPTRSRPRAMAALVAVVAFRSVIYSGMLVFVPLYAVNVLHHRPAENGPLLFAILGVGALATIAGAAIADRTSAKKTMLGSFALVPPLLAFYLLVPTIVGVVALVLVGACLIATTTVSVIMAQDLMPGRIALASSLVIGFTSGLGGLAIAGLGRLADVAGLPAVLWSLVAFAVVGTALSAGLPDDAAMRRPEDAVEDARNLATSVAHR